MQFRPVSHRLKGCLLATLLAASIPAAQAVDDVLKTPAMPSELAPKTLLLDVTRAGGRLVAVGQRGHIVYSDDQGKTWRQASVPVSTTLTAVYFSSPSKGWAVGHSGVVLATSDSGQTWQKQFDGNMANALVVAQSEAIARDLEDRVDNAKGAEGDELQTKLEDAQMAVDDAKADAEIGASKPFLDVWFKNDQEGFIVGAYGYFFHTIDGGQTWTSWAGHLENPDRLHLNAIAQVTGGALFIAGEAGHLFRSTDQGETWKTLKSPYEGSFFGVTGTGNVNEVLVMGLRGHLFRSDNLGASWSEVKTGEDITLMGADFDDSGHMAIVGNSGVILESSDYGQSFDSYVREDRDSSTAVVLVKGNELLMVGESGAKLTDLQGRDVTP